MNSPPRPRDEHGGPHKDHGIQRDSRGEDQPTDKRRAQQTTQGDQSGARERPPSPRQPAGGE